MTTTPNSTPAPGAEAKPVVSPRDGLGSPAWQPIETAPRDRNIIGGYFNQPWAESHREGRIVQCWYQSEFAGFVSSCRMMQMHNGNTFEDGSTSRLHSPVMEDVTHWMPLPEPPAHSPSPSEAA